MVHRLKTIREQVERAQYSYPIGNRSLDLRDKIYLLEVIDKLSVDAGVMQVALKAITQIRTGESFLPNALVKYISSVYTITTNALEEIGE